MIGEYAKAGTEISIPNWYDRKNLGMTDSVLANGNGGSFKMDGWGSDAMGLAGGVGNMFLQYNAAKAQQKDADRRFALMEGESKKNWAMRMNEYRQFQNRISHDRATKESFLDGNGHLRGDDAAQFAQGNEMLDWRGQAKADPFSVSGDGSIVTNTPQSNIANSSFAQAAPANSSFNNFPATATTTPQSANQKAGGSDVRPKQPGDRARDAEKKRVEKLTV